MRANVVFSGSRRSEPMEFGLVRAWDGTEGCTARSDY